MAVLFAKRLREGIRRGEIICSVRIWRSQRVKVGGRYRLDTGRVVVDAVAPIALADIDGDLARRSGFDGVVDLLKVANHGEGENVYLVSFHHVDGAG